MESEPADAPSGADKAAVDGTNGATARDARWLAIFEDRHGEGSYERLLEQLRQPCLTFAAIASQFGVTRERVRQWHAQLLPDAPSGHERQRLCGLHNQKRRLLAEPMFRSFYRHARPHFAAGRIELIKALDGYRSRSVRIDDRLVAIRDASGSATVRSRSKAVTYRLTRCRWAADFVYYRLGDSDYLFVPAHLVPEGGTMFSETPNSKYHRYRNTFEAFETASGFETTREAPAQTPQGKSREALNG
jgi:hypothetical protein